MVVLKGYRACIAGHIILDWGYYKTYTCNSRCIYFKHIVPVACTKV